MPEQTPYGIDWPEWATFTAQRGSTNKFSADLRQTRSELEDEMDRLGADDYYVDEVSGSGFPGVVIRWRTGGADHAVACDDYTAKKSNLREAFLWIKETRKRADRPVETGQDEFAAAQLPPGDGEETIAAQPVQDEMDRERAAEILEVQPDASEDTIRGAFERRVRKGHADHGGGEDVAELKDARDTLLEE